MEQDNYRKEVLYQQLPIFDAKTIDPSTYLIIPPIISSSKVQELITGYLTLAERNPPSWHTYTGQDGEARAFELLSEDCPEICMWRGADFGIDGKDYSIDIGEAIDWVFGSFDGDRKHPILVGVPLQEVVQAYIQEKILFCKTGLSPAQTGFIPYGKTVGLKHFHPWQFRPPSIFSNKERVTWRHQLMNELYQKQGKTLLPELLKAVIRRLDP